jgi:hypothetical protein
MSRRKFRCFAMTNGSHFCQQQDNHAEGGRVRRRYLRSHRRLPASMRFLARAGPFAEITLYFSPESRW